MSFYRRRRDFHRKELRLSFGKGNKVGSKSKFGVFADAHLNFLFIRCFRMGDMDGCFPFTNGADTGDICRIIKANDIVGICPPFKGIFIFKGTVNESCSNRFITFRRLHRDNRFTNGDGAVCLRSCITEKENVTWLFCFWVANHNAGRTCKECAYLT